MSRSTLLSLLAGAAGTGAATVVVVTVGVAVGVWSRPSLLLVPAGVAATGLVAYLAHRSLPAGPFRLGAVAAGGGAVALEAAGTQPGLGAVQMAALVTAAALAVGGPALLRPLTRPLPGWVPAVGLVAVGLVLAWVVVGGGELGHDEAAYALKARSWLEGTPDSGWSIHRGVGQSVLAAAVWPVAGSAAGLRATAVVVSVLTVVAVGVLGTAVRSPRVGVAAAAVFAVAPSFVRRGAEFLSDVPSTGLLVVAATLLWRWLTSEPARHSLLYGAAVAGALAFYVRYQSLLSLALLAAGAIAAHRGRVVEEWPTVGRAAALGGGLVVPHLVWATAETGVPWGVVATTAQAGGRAYLGEGLVDYLRGFPDLLAGQLGAVAMVGSLVWLGWALRRGESRRPALFLLVPAVGQFLSLGLVSHGEPRFVFFPVALMAVAAATGADDLAERLPTATYRAGVAALAVAVVASLAVNGERADRNAESRAGTVAALVEAAEVVVARAGDGCGIVTGYRPQLTWLSGCPTEDFADSEPHIPFPPGRDVFLVLAERGVRQPQGELLSAYLARTDGAPTVIDSDGSLGEVAVWKVAR